ncbi:hypothetical protein ACLB90_15820 [Stenotrophomonas sp. LGBM10]|uniref:hypothetical protein n=1 Tax=Stenotrophomonas sp. LGBM10 TaxID=3390038 RepID=UPI00398A8742
MNVNLAIRVDPLVLMPHAFLDTSKAWLSQLGEAHHDFAEWWAVPRGPRDAFVPFSAREQMLARLQADHNQLSGELPGGLRDGAVDSVVLTNAGNEKDWARRGKVALFLNFAKGQIRLRIGKVEKVYDHPGQVLWSLLATVTKGSRVRFAQTNVQQKVGDELLLYSIHRAPFLHREYLGWMGYVDQSVTAAQVPEAARLERQGNGTLILATDFLDLGNPAAIKQANKVEMSLVDLDLLPVIDPSLR